MRDLVETMYAAPGIGLAANQIGVPLRVCVVDPSGGGEQGALRVLINPRVLETEGSQVGEEGCLSFPDITLEIERPFRARVEALDPEGQIYTLEGEDLLARVMLHEISISTARCSCRTCRPLAGIVKRSASAIKAGDWVTLAAVRGSFLQLPADCVPVLEGDHRADEMASWSLSRTARSGARRDRFPPRWARRRKRSASP